MKILTWQSTIELAHILSNLDTQSQEVSRIAELLKVDRVEYKHGNIIIYDDSTQPFTMDRNSILCTYGAYGEVWTRLIIRDIELVNSPYWVRDDDLSAMFLQHKDSDYGVFYHRYDEGSVEFKVVLEYSEHFYSPFRLLYTMLKEVV